MLSGEVLEDILLTSPLIDFYSIWLWVHLTVMDKTSSTDDPSNQSYPQPNPLNEENWVENYYEKNKACENTSDCCVGKDQLLESQF